MIWIAFYFCCGIIFARFIHPPFGIIFVFAALLAVAGLLAARKGFLSRVLFPFLILSVGAALFINAGLLPKSHISKFISYKNETVFTVKGFVNSQPQLKEEKVSFIFYVQELEFYRSHYKSCGNILVHLRGAGDFAYGEALILRGSMRRPHKFYSDNIYAVMHVGLPGAVVRLRKNYGWPIKRLALSIKDRVEEIIYREASPLAAGILGAMVLGEKRNIPSVIYDAMIKSGTVHILVVSGFNVGVVAFIIMLLLKVSRVPRKPRYGLAIFSLIIYCFATGASTPVVRATIMAIFFLGGFLLKREPDMRNSFSLAALVILFMNPRALFSISFQLSFASVAAIFFLYPKLKSFFGVEFLKLRFLRIICEGCLVSLSAWLGAFGFILAYFGVFAPVTVLANIFIVPLATLITLSGFSLVIISLALPGCSSFFAWAIEFLVASLLSVNSLLIQLPFAYLYVK